LPSRGCCLSTIAEMPRLTIWARYSSCQSGSSPVFASEFVVATCLPSMAMQPSKHARWCCGQSKAKQSKAKAEAAFPLALTLEWNVRKSVLVLDLLTTGVGFRTGKP
jgi:hypothetical protein